MSYRTLACKLLLQGLPKEPDHRTWISPGKTQAIARPDCPTLLVRLGRAETKRRIKHAGQSKT